MIPLRIISRYGDTDSIAQKVSYGVSEKEKKKKTFEQAQSTHSEVYLQRSCSPKKINCAKFNESNEFNKSFYTLLKIHFHAPKKSLPHSI